MRAPTIVALVLAFICAGCSSAESPEEDAGDGKFHPEPNGVRTTEEQACNTLQGAFQSHALSMQCSTTVRPCPQFLRVQFQTACMEYDEGSVQGCVEFYQSKTACPELDAEGCVITAYPGSEPAGCP